MSGVLDYRLDVVEKDVGEIKNAIKSIAGSLQTLTRLEERHLETRESLNRAFDALAAHEKRIQKLEVQAPTTKLITSWVIAAATGSFVIVIFALAQDVL